MTDNFLGLGQAFAELNTAKFVVLPICYDGTVSFLKGTVEAPEAIIAASGQLEFFDEILLDEFYRCGICTADAINSEGETPEQMQEKIYRTAKEFVQAGKIIISLGGEHSITAALVKVVAEKFSDLSVLQIDAHADLRDEYEGSRYSHACVMRRVYDMQIPAVCVGLRSFDKNQYDFLIENSFKTFSPRMIAHKKDWILEVIESLSDNVYVTLDIDGLDPAEAPGTGTPEPGGLKYYQVVDLILALGRSRNIVGADIMEVIPGIAGMTTEFLAARLAYKIIAAAQLKK